jgi:VRR-NUC domain
MSGRAIDSARAAMGNRDANHGEITKAYQELYCTVQDTHGVGHGFPDLVVKITTAAGPVACLVEVKTADGTLRLSQERFIAAWGSCVTVVQTREDVFAHVERVRRKGCAN